MVLSGVVEDLESSLELHGCTVAQLHSCTAAPCLRAHRCGGKQRPINQGTTSSVRPKDGENVHGIGPTPPGNIMPPKDARDAKAALVLLVGFSDEKAEDCAAPAWCVCGRRSSATPAPKGTKSAIGRTLKNVR
jgi:hypothetical protein